jgi:hypothetical protein
VAIVVDSFTRQSRHKQEFATDRFEQTLYMDRKEPSFHYFYARDLDQKQVFLLKPHGSEPEDSGQSSLSKKPGRLKLFLGEFKYTATPSGAIELNRVQGLFSIRGTRRIAPFSTRMRFWRDTVP